jgi:hypothetical protein
MDLMTHLRNLLSAARGGVMWKTPLILALVTILLVTGRPANAICSNTLTSLHDYLKGVDTIVIDDSFAPRAEKVLGVTHFDTKRAVRAALNDIFYAHKYIKIPESPSQTWADNVLVLIVEVSAREEQTSTGTIKIGAINVRLSRQNAGDGLIYKGEKTSIVSPLPYSYPFVASDDTEEIAKKMQEGVTYLTAMLPNIINCTNKYDEDLCKGAAEYKYGEPPGCNDMPN